MRTSFFVCLLVLSTLVGCKASTGQPPEKDDELRRFGELKETRTSPPYFQLKAGCKLPEMSFDDGWRQLKVMEFLDQKIWSNIVLRSEQEGGKYGRLGFFEDHTLPESDEIKNIEKLYLRERNLSLIDNRAVREIADMHCNKGATFGGIVSDISPNYGDVPDRMRLKTIIHDPRPSKFPAQPTEPGRIGEPFFLKTTQPFDDTNRYGVIICFESQSPRTYSS